MINTCTLNGNTTLRERVTVKANETYAVVASSKHHQCIFKQFRAGCTSTYEPQALLGGILPVKEKKRKLKKNMFSLNAYKAEYLSISKTIGRVAHPNAIS